MRKIQADILNPPDNVKFEWIEQVLVAKFELDDADTADTK